MPGPEQIKTELKHAEEKAAEGLKEAKHIQKEVSGVLPFVADLDLPSMAVGFSLALFVFLILTFVWKSGKILLKIGLILAIIVFVSSAYFGWLSRAAGLSKSSFSNPAHIVHDAKDAAAKMKARLKEEERMLKK